MSLFHRHMGLFHRHKWRKTGATYAPPWDKDYVEPEGRKGFIYHTGMTTIFLQCPCGAWDTAIMAGKPIDKALADLVGVEENE